MKPDLQFVLLPGLHGSDELWQPFLDAVPRGLPPLPVSYPSGVPSGYSSIEAFVRNVLPTDSPFVVIAESFSGPVGISIAAAPPDNMLALVLCNSFVALPFSSLWASFPWKTLFRIPGPSLIIRRYFVGQSASAVEVQKVRDLVLRSDPAVLAARVRLVLKVDLREELSRIGIPVLYVRGTKDRLVPNQALQTIRHLLPSVTVSFIPAPHFTLQVAPSEAWQAIDRFSENIGLTTHSSGPVSAAAAAPVR